MGKLTMDTIETPNTPNTGDSTMYFDETSKTLKSVDDAGDITEYLSTSTDNNFPSQDIHVSINGSDTTGNGETNRPYATIKHAISTVTDASTSKRYAIKVSVGTFVEDNPVICKDYVSIIGSASSTTVITALNINNNLFEITANTSLTNMLLVGPSGASSVQVTGSGLVGLLSVVTSSSNKAVSLNTTPGSEFIMVSCSFRNASTAVESLGEDNIVITTCQFLNCSTDLTISNINTKLNTESVRMSRDKIILPDGFDNFFGSFSDSKAEDEALILYNEFSVGRPEAGKESCFGEGDSYTRGMFVFTYNQSSGTYINVTDDVVDPTDNNYVEFTGLAVNNAIYACTTLKDNNSAIIAHLGQKTKVIQAQVGGEVVLEYYNGATWVDLTSMGVNSSNNYITYGQDYLQTVGAHQVRFNDSVTNTWVSNDPMSLGTNYYWVRFRIKTEITTSPQISQIKIHSNRTEINGDGYLEYFGKARPINTLPIIYGAFQAATSSPGNQDIFISDNIGVGMIENNFANGATDRTGMAFYVPLDLDTSSPLRFRLSYFGTTNGTDSVDWVIRYGYTAPGDSIYTSTADSPTTGPNEQSVTRSTAMPAIEETLQSEIFELDVSGIITERSNAASGDILWITIQRTGGTDTYGGNLIMVSISPYYTKWRDGGHINNWL